MDVKRTHKPVTDKCEACGVVDKKPKVPSMDVHHTSGQYGSVGIHGASIRGGSKRSAEYETSCMRKLMKHSVSVSREVLLESEESPCGYGYPELRYRRITLYETPEDFTDGYPTREYEKRTSKLALYFAGVRPSTPPPSA